MKLLPCYIQWVMISSLMYFTQYKVVPCQTAQTWSLDQNLNSHIDLIIIFTHIFKTKDRFLYWPDSSSKKAVHVFCRFNISMNLIRRSAGVLYLVLATSRKQQVFHISVTMELFQCICCCFPSCYEPRRHHAHRHWCFWDLIGLLNLVPGFIACALWQVFWGGEILTEGRCFLQQMYKRTNSGVMGLSDRKESSGIKSISHMTMIKRFRSSYVQGIILKLLNSRRQSGKFYVIYSWTKTSKNRLYI